MTEKLVLKDVLKQEPGSAVVYLYEIEFTKGNFAYFHDGVDASLGNVTMLDLSLIHISEPTRPY